MERLKQTHIETYYYLFASALKNNHHEQAHAYLQSLLGCAQDYNPNQPRDDHGRFASGGSRSNLPNLQGISVELDDMDKDVKQRALMELNTLMGEYPYVKEQINAIRLSNEAGGSIQSRVITLGKELVSTKQQNIQPIESVIRHEFGHALEHAIIRHDKLVVSSGIVGISDEIGYSTHLLQRWADTAMVKSRSGISSLGHYANTDRSEFIAEAFAKGKGSVYGRQLHEILKLYEKASPKLSYAGATPAVKKANEEEVKTLLSQINRIT